MLIGSTQFLPSVLNLFFFVLLLFFTIYALFLSFHWFKYGSSKRISMIALAVYLGGGAFLLLTIALALQLT